MHQTLPFMCFIPFNPLTSMRQKVLLWAHLADTDIDNYGGKGLKDLQSNHLSPYW